MLFFGPPNVLRLMDKGDYKGLIKALRYKDTNVRRMAVRALFHVLSATNMSKAWKTFDVNPLVPSLLPTDIGKARELFQVPPGWRKIAAAQDIVMADLVAYFKEIRSEICDLIAIACDIYKFSGVASNYEAQDVLKELGEAALRPLMSALKHENTDVSAAAAAQVLERIGGPQAERALAEYRAGQG